MSLSLSECAELPEDLDGMDTLTLRMLRDSQHKLLILATNAMLVGEDGAKTAVREIGERIRRINAALDRKDGLTD